MKPMIVTSATGDVRRLNPMQIAGWKAGDVPAQMPDKPGLVYAGTILIMADGTAVGVLEGEREIDRMFLEATGETIPLNRDFGVSARTVPTRRRKATAPLPPTVV